MIYRISKEEFEQAQRDAMKALHSFFFGGHFKGVKLEDRKFRCMERPKMEDNEDYKKLMKEL